LTSQCCYAAGPDFGRENGVSGVETQSSSETASPAEGSRLSGGTIHPLWLRFADSTLERRYQVHQERQAARHSRLLIITAVLAFASYGIVEYLLLAEQAWLVFAIRYGLALPLVLLTLSRTLAHDRQRLRAESRMASLAVVHLCNLALFVLVPFPENDIYLFFVALLVVYTEGLSLVPVRRTALLGGGAVMIYMLALALMPGPTPLEAGLRVMALLALFAVSVGNHFNQELATRRDFRRRRLLEEQTRRAGELAEAATAANSAKSRFLAMMSHELRTPLNAIIGFSEIIKSEMFGPVGDNRYCEYAGDIDQSGRHLLAIINDLLDLSKAEAEHLQLLEQHIDMHDTPQAALAMVRNTEAGADKHFIVDVAADLPHLWADGQRVQQMLLNLLSNACKFTDADGEIRVYGRLDNGGIEVGVADSGIGIAAEDIERVLSPFVQVDSLYSRRYEGTGLGLPLVKALIELHGGRLQVESEVGAGTDVRLIFPPYRTKPDISDEFPLAALKRSPAAVDDVASAPGGTTPWRSGRSDASSA